MTHYVHTKCFHPDGTADSHRTFEVESKDAPMPHHKLGLSYTASGYGKRIPTHIMVNFEGKWRRVYVYQYPNAGTAYIGDWIIGRGAKLTVSEVYYEYHL